jgi:hypothetical protein
MSGELLSLLRHTSRVIIVAPNGGVREIQGKANSKNSYLDRAAEHLKAASDFNKRPASSAARFRRAGRGRGAEEHRA